MAANIHIMLELDSAPSKSEYPCPPDVEEQVRRAIDLVDSGHESGVEWLLLNKLYNSLCGMRKKSERVQNLISMIEPVLAKFGYHRVSSTK